MALVINSTFDSGNIKLLSISDAGEVHLEIEKDQSSDFLQWFYFSLSGAKGKTCQISIDNAGATSYAKGWENYNVACSSDRQQWIRTPAEYDGKSLTWTVTPDTDVVWFAYFAPYSLEQHADLIGAAANAVGVDYQCLGETDQGRSIDYLKVNALLDESANDAVNKARLQLWVIARQHPGESMTEWWMEGWLDRLLDHDDATSRALRGIADIHVVPNMNPDGSVLGHLRTNAKGINLNREWSSPSIELSPEVYFVRQKMHDTGIDIALDVHGDEALPYNFIAGTEGIANWTPERDAQLVAFKQTWAAINPDFQYAHGYPKNTKGNANLSICSNYLAHTFDCLAMTLEMPFKDTADTPRVDFGWSPERSMRLGASFVDVVYLAMTNRLLSAAY
jgi:murein tripeptide amidase MpaA